MQSLFLSISCCRVILPYALLGKIVDNLASLCCKVGPQNIPVAKPCMKIKIFCKILRFDLYLSVACRASLIIELPCQTSFCLFFILLLVCFRQLSTLLSRMCAILIVYCTSCVCYFATWWRVHPQFDAQPVYHCYFIRRFYWPGNINWRSVYRQIYSRSAISA